MRKAARRGVLALARPMGALIRAVPGLVGLGALAYGAWLAYPPAGWMVAGGGVLLDVMWSRRRPEPEQVSQ